MGRLCCNAGMFRPLSAYLGTRYASARRGRGFLSIISSVAIGGLALGTAVLVLVLAVLGGFERELRERVLALLPHVLIYDAEGFADWRGTAARLEALPGITAAAPWAGGAVLLATPTGVRAAQLSGIDPAAERRVSILERFTNVPSRRHAPLAELASRRYGILLGDRLADALGVTIGDPVTVILAEAAVTPLGVFPRQKRFRIVGIVTSGTEVDDGVAYVHLEDAQRLWRLANRTPAIRLRLVDLFASGEAVRQASAALAPAQLAARDWTMTHGTLYQAIRLQRTTMFLLLSLVIAVAAYNVVSSLVMVVQEKQREIAILRSLGFSRGGIARSFVVLGGVVGLTGVVVGAAMGLTAAYWVADAVAALQETFGVQLLSQYFVHYLPSEPRFADAVWVGGIGMLLTLVASVYPAWRAARARPTEILRHE